MFPFESFEFVVELLKLIAEIPASSKVNILPSPFKTFKSAKCSSLELIIPSLFESKSASASKPEVARVPFAFI